MPKIRKAFNWTNLRRLRDDSQRHGRILDEDLQAELAPDRIFAASGRLTLPVIDKGERNELFLVATRIAKRTADLFLQRQDLGHLRDDLRLSDVYRTVIVSYHKWMWEYVAYLDARGQVRRPFAFAHPDEAEPHHIGQLVFLVQEPTGR